MIPTRKIVIVFFLLFILKGLYFQVFSQSFAESEVVKVQSRRHTIFSIFSEISRQTSYYFIYDSELINNNQQVDIKRGEYTINELLEIILTNDSLGVEFRDKYIVIYRKPDLADTVSDSEPIAETKGADTTALVVRGRVVDSSSQEALSFASIVLKGRGQGISANQEGLFNLKIPAEFSNDTLKISFMGYTSRYIPLKLLQDVTTDIYMDVETQSLSEVVVTGYNPMKVLSSAIEAKDELYPQEPTLHTSFYREGVFKNDDLLQYSEAVFEIYKSSYRGNGADQVKILKSRNISNNDIKDSVIIKLKAGIQGMLELDIVKHPPAFFIPLNLIEFQYPDAGFVNHDAGSAYAITFEPANYVSEGVYEGTIYIDTESLAILQVDFGITSSYLALHQNRFLPRRSKFYNTRIKSMNYSVRYAWHNGAYHIKHVRGEIMMRIRERNKLFGNNYSAFFEMAVMDIETEDVKRFSRRETIRPAVIFTDQDFVYDAEFWEDFNFIIPEQRITTAMQHFSVEIEKIEYPFKK